VRQSTLLQVEHNRESTLRQYELADIVTGSVPPDGDQSKLQLPVITQHDGSLHEHPSPRPQPPIKSTTIIIEPSEGRRDSTAVARRQPPQTPADEPARPESAPSPAPA